MEELPSENSNAIASIAKKSSRHSKIIGDFGENLVLYWLSKIGFECARVDHTGIDLLAAHSETKQKLVISVKSRTRSREGSQRDGINLDESQFIKINKACEDFGYMPCSCYRSRFDKSNSGLPFATRPCPHLDKNRNCGLAHVLFFSETLFGGQ